MLRRHARHVVVASSALALAAASALATNAANAQFDPHDRQTGIEGSVHLGYGGLSNGGAFQQPGATPNYGSLHGSFGMQFHVGYRIIPVLSAGLHVGWNYLSANSGGATAAGGGATGVGLYARLHILAFMQHRERSMSGTPDLYFGAGLDFFASVDAWTHTVTNVFGTIVTVDTSLATSGIAVPLQLGFDYWVSDHVAVGVLGQLAPWTAPTVCGRVNAGGPNCDTRDRQSEVFYFIGAGVTGHFNLVH